MYAARALPRSILVPLDGSPEADRVLPVVERLGAAVRARLLLLGVVADLNPATTHDSQALGLVLSNQAASRRQAELALSAVTDQLRGHGLPTRSVVAQGDPAEAILATSDKHHIDLIAMATQSRRGFDRVLFGSVSGSVIQHARVPVLVVPRAAARWPAGQALPVLVPLDGSPLAEIALSAAGGLAMALRGDLHLVRVCEEDQRLRSEGYLRDLAARMGTDGLSVRTHVTTGSSPSDAILQVVHDQRIGILALATHGRGGLLRAVMGSVASEILARADVPVLLLGPNSARSRNARDLFAAEADSAALRHR